MPPVRGDYDRGVPEQHPPERRPEGHAEHVHRELRPARVNAKALFLLGTAAWLVGLIGCGVAALAGRSPDPLLAWICVAGIFFGAAGYCWAHYVHLVDDEGMSR